MWSVHTTARIPLFVFYGCPCCVWSKWRRSSVFASSVACIWTAPTPLNFFQATRSQKICHYWFIGWFMCLRDILHDLTWMFSRVFNNVFKRQAFPVFEYNWEVCGLLNLQSIIGVLVHLHLIGESLVPSSIVPRGVYDRIIEYEVIFKGRWGLRIPHTVTLQPEMWHFSQVNTHWSLNYPLLTWCRFKPDSKSLTPIPPLDQITYATGSVANIYWSKTAK